MTVANTTPYTNGQSITISGANISNSNASSNINGHTFYIQVDANFSANSNVVGSGNVVLYTDTGLITTANGAGLTSYTIDTGIATAILGGSGSGSVAGGSNTTVQFNDQGTSNGVAGFTFDKNTTTLTVSSGNIITGNLNATSTITSLRLISNIATGTSPLVVTSTTQVANLNAATAGVAYSVAGANVSGAVSYATTANAVAGANVSGAVSYATTANSVAVANVSGIGNIATTNIDGNASNILYGNGIFASAPSPGVVYGNSNVATFLASFGSNTITTTGNVSVGNIIGNGSQLTGLPAPTVAQDITSTGNMSIMTYDGNLKYVNNATVEPSTGNITSAGNITASNMSVGTGNVTLGTLTTGANTTAGTITGNFSLSAGSRLNATFADLAEYYEADNPYEAGTVLEFGGDKEVTLAEDNTTRVAGVVSTNPAYVMNSTCEGEHTVALALQGRVPCKVRGKIFKGDMLVSGGNGFARPVLFPVLGTVIGKALENFDGVEGIIEVAVGRL
jgi:hypothetical protein